MLLNGKRISEPNQEFIVIPRPDEDIVFTAKAILDMSEFEMLFPRPDPPTIRHKDGTRAQDPSDKRYLSKIEELGTRRFDYIVIKSLEATDGLEWETIDISNPETWGNYRKELMESGFSDVEVNRIVVGVMNANSLNESRIEEARRHFLASRQEARNGQSSQEVEASIMPSGEAAND